MGSRMRCLAPPSPSPLFSSLQVRCTTVPGVGGPFNWVVSVGGVSGTVSSVSNTYTSPTLTSVTLSPSTLPGLATAGGQSLVLVGSNFGPFATELARLRVR